MKYPAFGLRTRIYISMLMLILLSLAVIGIVTVLHFKSQSEIYHSERLKRKERAVLSGIGYFLNHYSISNRPEDMAIVLGEKFDELADINKLHINVYDLEGSLLVSAKSDSIALFVPSAYLLPDVVKTINIEGQLVQRIEKKEHLFLSSFSVIYNNQQEPLAIIQIPYLEQEDRLKNELETFFVKLAQAYIFLLLGASVVAFFLSRYITRSLQTISAKLKSLKINKKNEPLEWGSNDEIGELVAEYNRMLQQLEESAETLAKSERESAWREMAKQVAHEIKNPLTPMKLSVQHLQRSWANQADDLEGQLEHFSKTLIEQIDTLSTIASEFSDFAQMPRSKTEAVNIESVAQAAVGLFHNTPNTDIRLAEPLQEKVFVWADRDQLLRVFNNLIKNAIQAIPAGKNGSIMINLGTTTKLILVAISDDGSGIPNDLQETIFAPNFTTKTGGMGLGLAMVKNIVEAAGGKVWFETSSGKGTTFFVEFPRHIV